jgi:hypothetical protein
VPSTSSRRVSLSSAVHTSRPPGSQAGTPGTISSQAGSVSSRNRRVAPLAGSAASSRMARWSRDWTSRVSGPSAAQTTVTRYGNASRSQSTSTRPPARSTTARRTSALAVPAAGYGADSGGTIGLVGSDSHQRRTGEVSTRATASRSPSGDHQ